MLNEETGKRFAELAKNDEAMKVFAEADTITERVAVLARYKIEVTEEELEALEKIIDDDRIKALFESGEELTEESLEKVSGGILWALGGIAAMTISTLGGLGGVYGVYKFKNKVTNSVSTYADRFK